MGTDFSGIREPSDEKRYRRQDPIFRKGPDGVQITFRQGAKKTLQLLIGPV